MVNLKKYEMKSIVDFEWIDRYIKEWGIDKFSEYHDKVIKALDQLSPGHYYDIAGQVPEDKQELFVKICCGYAQAYYPYYEFSDDYTQIWNITHRYEQWKLDKRGRKIPERKHCESTHTRDK